MKNNTIGIDFGTTNTLVSFYDEDRGEHRAIPLGISEKSIPTVVYVDDDGAFYFGNDAEDRMVEHPERYCRGFKMRLASYTPALSYLDGRMYPKSYRASELTSSFLSYIKARVEEEVFGGEAIKMAVITCPVLFSPVQREELLSAARAAGFEQVSLADEPAAAGLAFSRLCPEESFGSTLVVDWGGGTLDLALVTRSGQELVTHYDCVAGLMSKGGEHFDDLLEHYLAERFSSEHNLDLNTHSNNSSFSLKKRMRKEKESLSHAMEKTVILVTKQQKIRSILLERSQFEQLIAPHVQEAAAIAVQLLESIRAKGYEPESLHLIGGSVEIPLIQSHLAKKTGLDCKRWSQHREAVSLGASMMALDAYRTLHWRDYYLEGRRAFWGDEKQARDLLMAHAIFLRGHEAGDWNCSYSVALALWTGQGAAKDCRRSVAICQDIFRKGYYPAASILREAYENGIVVDMSSSKATFYLESVIEYCQESIAHVNDDIRMRVFIQEAMASAQYREHPKLEMICEEYYHHGFAPIRIALYGNYLLHVGKEQDAIRIWDEGIELARDAYSMINKGFYLCQRASTREVKYKACDMIRCGLATDGRLRDVVAWLCYEDRHEEHVKQARSLYEGRNHLGISLIKAAHTLDVRVQLLSSAMEMRIYHDDCSPGDFAEYVAKKNIFLYNSRRLSFTNATNKGMAKIRLKITFPKKGKQRTMLLPEPIAAQNTYELDFEEHGIIASVEEFFCELELNDQYCHYHFSKDASREESTHEKLPFPAVLRIKRHKGKNVLEILTMSQLKHVFLTRRRVRKWVFVGTIEPRRVESINIEKIRCNIPFEVGEEFILECEGYSPMTCRLMAPL